MGWDAFGLPRENYAIKTGTHPRITTDQNIENYKRQIGILGISYDWDREIDTTDPKYYKWTQWIFLKLFEAGLAYEQDLPINYCPSCKTGLANEEVLNDGTCDRCGTSVEKKKIRQWVLAITKYADRLATDVDKLDWPEGIKDMQRNWIGRSEGAQFKMFDEKQEKFIEVYTTRIDTVFGMTYAVMAPDHKDVMEFIEESQKQACLAYIEEAKNKSDQDRTTSKEKTGVFTGTYVINPFNGEKIPVYIGDYVLGNYGTGAVMAVPAHDERDFEFAKKMGIEVKYVIGSTSFNLFGEDLKEKYDTIVINEYPVFLQKERVFTEDGTLVDSGDFSGLSSAEARTKLTEYALKNGFGTKKVNYKLRDWLFSRQRYWGEPIPLIHISLDDYEKLPKISSMTDTMEANKAYIFDKKGTEKRCHNCDCGDIGCTKLIINGKAFSKIYDGIYTKIVCDYNLPLQLPEVEDFAPSGDGQSPLAKVDNFVNIKLADNLNGKRETNTMPQWGGSCWYYLRYMDPNNSEKLVDPEVEKYWGQVDSYVGGAEHAVLHLLYARFWHKFLFDIGVVSHDEPFYRLRNQGLIQAFAYQRANGGLVANDLVEEKDGKFYEKSTGEELKQIISKMSKSLKNVVNPDDIVEEYGADSLRLYEMYMADFKDSAPWNPTGIVGVRRFIERLERIFEEDRYSADDKKVMKQLHKTIKKVGEDIENYKFNTAISSMMILLNEGMPKDEKLKREWKETFIKLVHPFAPHLAEELWERLGNKTSVFASSWPKFDENMAKDDVVVIGVQVLGKLRGEIEINIEEDEKSVLEKAHSNEQVAKWLDGKTIVKEIYVKGKIVNIVVK
ncbi:MAG: class I tRNA ligase family protein [Candidatus Gracilibacteria bacterium]|nr:class I tRNA ligase family protein [Candidatus Gracilibacteria bacterium]